jgi:hypothetical protein
LQTFGTPDGKDQLSDMRPLAPYEWKRRQLLVLDLEQCQIRLLVETQQPRFANPTFADRR